MKFTLADKFIAWLTLLSGLSISAVAVWYSVAGLVSIFSASPVPIIVMGVTLEVSKLVATIWLKINWDRAPFFVKAYLMSAIMVLMLITSMGIFGYLSKAHSDQTLISGDVSAKLVLIDEKIKIERENIANAQSVIKQMDAAVTGIMSTGDQEFKRNDGTTGVRSAAERSLQVRRSQAKDRAALTAQIEEAQAKIIKLQEEAAPIRAESRKVEAEVGPIKYIAKLIYSDNPDANLLEKAVTWVIIIIVAVFDPLAVVLLIASQYSFQWFRETDKEDEHTPDPYVADVGDKPTEEELSDWQEEDIDELVKDTLQEIDQPNPHHPDTRSYLTQGFNYPADYERVGPIVANSKITNAMTDEEIVKLYTESQPADETDEEKEARRRWKEENPDSTIKRQEYLKEIGKIDKLPWEEESKKKSSYITREDNQQIKKIKD